MSIDPRDAARFGPEALRLAQRQLEEKAALYAKLHPETGEHVHSVSPIRRVLRRLRGGRKRRD